MNPVFADVSVAEIAHIRSKLGIFAELMSVRLGRGTHADGFPEPFMLNVLFTCVRESVEDLYRSSQAAWKLKDRPAVGESKIEVANIAADLALFAMLIADRFESINDAIHAGRDKVGP